MHLHAGRRLSSCAHPDRCFRYNPRMLKTVAAIALAAGVFTAPAQQASSPAQPTAAACPTTTTLDDLIKALYAAVSGPYDQDRTCFRDLFLPDARLSPSAKPQTAALPLATSPSRTGSTRSASAPRAISSRRGQPQRSRPTAISPTSGPPMSRARNSTASPLHAASTAFRLSLTARGGAFRPSSGRRKHRRRLFRQNIYHELCNADPRRS
jgi:hypothetical protein